MSIENARTAATVRIRNLIVAVHEGEDGVNVAVYPAEDVGPDSALDQIWVAYDGQLVVGFEDDDDRISEDEQAERDLLCL